MADRLISTVEKDMYPFDIQQPVDIVIVLGSGHKDLNNTPAVMELGSSALFSSRRRFAYFKRQPQRKIVRFWLSGGMTESHADVMRKAAIELGTKPNRIKAFPLAKDTQEEAKSMAFLLKRKTRCVSHRSVAFKTSDHLFQASGNRHYASPRHVLRIRKK